MVAADADGVPGEHVGLSPATGQTEMPQRGKEDLSIAGRNQVVEDRVDSRTHIKQHISDHVEVVVEVIKCPEEGNKRKKEKERFYHYIALLTIEL